MAKFHPRKDINNIQLIDPLTGDLERAKLMQESMEDTTGFLKPVEYDDIDQAVLEFVDKEIPMDADGKPAPTFTLFSNQRFSEYSQTWEHTDKEGNLLMDFKTVNRETDPTFGDMFEMHNIPGNRRYTLLTKTVTDESGMEYYETHSVEQPMPMDFTYTVNFITSKMEKINDFNLKVNRIFRGIQHYIHPNGHYMSMTLEDISDESEYSIDNRKIFIQTVTLLVKGFVIPKDSFRIDSVPKRINDQVALEKENRRAHVYIEDKEDKTFDIDLDFRPNVNKVEFPYEEDEIVRATIVKQENIRSFKLYIDGTRVISTSNGFLLYHGCEVKIEVVPVDPNFGCGMKLTCK